MKPQSFSIVRDFKFDSGHRVWKHESKCRTPHGHEYKLKVHARSKELDPLGRVVDFSVLKERIQPWLDGNWDHTMILHRDDPLTPLMQGFHNAEGLKPVFVVPWNPTAENLANYLLTTVLPVLMEDTGVEVWKVELWETSNCCCELELSTAWTRA